MNFQDLAYFNHLAETLNFTATAQHFYVSQPSISMALKRLEKELETVLIEREHLHKDFRLTETGKILHHHAMNILETIETAKEEISDLKNQAVYFGFLPTIGGYFMPKLMPHLSKYSPSLRLIEEESSDIMLDLVQRGEVPLAIVGSDKPSLADETILQIPLVTQEMALWGSTNNTLAKKAKVAIEDIQDQVFISLAEGYTHQRVFEEWTKQSHIDSPRTLYTKEIQTALSIAGSTDMLAFMIDILVKDTSKLVRIPIVDAPKFYISLIVNQTITPSYFQKEFNEVMIDLAKSYNEDNEKAPFAK